MRLLGECSVRQAGTESVGPPPFAVVAFQLVLVGWDGAGGALREMVTRHIGLVADLQYFATWPIGVPVVSPRCLIGYLHLAY